MMQFIDILQTASAVSILMLIVIGSLQLKAQLKQSFVK